MVEHATENRSVGGSIPPLGTITLYFYLINQKLRGQAHGLRKATASRLAELGCSTQEIMAITGHTTLKEVERYTAAARRKILAESAMAKFSEEE